MKKAHTSESFILRFARFLTDLFYHMIGAGVFGRIFSSYDKWNARFSSSVVARLGRGSQSRSRRAVRQNLALAVEENAVMRLLRSLRDRLLATSLRTFGIFFLVTAGYSAVTYWLISDIWGIKSLFTAGLAVGAVVAVFGTVLLFAEYSLGYALHHGKITGKLLVSLFDLPEDSFSEISKEGSRSYGVAVPLGMLCGVMFALMDPLHIILVVASVLLVFLEVSIPEAGIFLALLVVPFAGFTSFGGTLVTLAALLPLVGYFLKLIRGNRAFRVELQDFPVLLLLPVFFFSFVSFGEEETFSSAMQITLFSFSYLMVVNVLATAGWIFRARVALLISGTGSAIVGLVQFIYSLASQNLTENTVRAGFSTSAAFAYFLVLIYPLALYTIYTCKNQLRWPLLCVTLLIAGGTVISRVESAAVAVLLMSIVFFLLCERRFLFGGLFGGGVLLAAYAMLPNAWHRRLDGILMEKTASVPVWQIFRGSGSGVFSGGRGFSRFLFGLGSGGTEAFSRLFVPDYVPITAANANFYTFFLCEYGVIGLCFLLLFLFFLLQSAFSVFGSGKYGKSRFRAVPLICTVLGVIVISFFHYTWQDPAAVFLFFLVFGVLAAELRIERFRNSRYSMRENDENRVEYDYYLNGKE